MRGKPKAGEPGMERGATSGGWLDLVTHCSGGGIKQRDFLHRFLSNADARKTLILLSEIGLRGKQSIKVRIPLILMLWDCSHDLRQTSSSI